VRVQATLFFGLLPLAVVLFGRMSPSAPIVNLLVVPIFSLVTVPAALTGMALDGLFSQPGDMALRIAARSIGVVNRLIGLDLWQGAARLVVPGTGSLMVAILATAWAVLPAGCPGRGASLPAVLALLFWQPGGVATGCFQLTMLDVGQGLAVLVETERSALLYDAGPGWPGGGDLVESVLLPVLRQRGIAALDVTVISHADLDHVGGLTALAAAMPTGRLLAGEPIERAGFTAESCHGRRPWQRDGVRFEFITPAPGPRNEGNNLSCVLAVSAREHTALLTGDIERPVEAALAGEGRLRPTVLVTIPHHGSATSSSLEFVRATAPRLAVASAGYANRWGQPRPEVIHRWRSYGANVFSTVTGGGLGVTICPDRVGELRRARLERRRIWRLP
jgi:competence protein ComEC